MINKLVNFVKKKKHKIQINQNDIWLISYPRSGNTWMRLVLANYIWECPLITNLQELQAYIPDIHYERSGIIPKQFKKKHRVIKSHEKFRNDYSQVIYVYRNPFDCAWSYFHFMKDWKGSYSQFSEFAQDFLNGNLPYGSWADHLQEWSQLHKGKHIFLCYEDVVQEPRNYLYQILSFIGFEYDEQRADNALKNASAETVSKITNDKVFYGKDFTTFVKSPLGVGKQMKEQIRSEYALQFADWNNLYEEFRFSSKT
ncbi:MAG: sulfotransferase domain-containing protein [Chloroflexi bacterium]|nr:sulfotransferase domain-containing protein [Chloroflexota bacterium]NOG76546.1 sulfotransferase domain-containing protein [Chloroflexota bacterium]